MIPIERLHYKIDMKLDKLASNAHQHISQENKDFALNEAQLKLIKQKVDINNQYQAGMDSFRKRYQDLEFLVVPHEKYIPVKDKMPVSSFSLPLSTLKKEFFLPIDIYTESSKDGCKDRIVVIEQIARHSDVPVLLDSSDTEPSFEYQSTIATISSGSLMIYSGDFIIDKVYISYLCYPNRVCWGDYEGLDGTLQARMDSEFPEFLEDELIEIAVQDIALSTENQFAAQAAAIRAKQGE